MRRSRRAGTGAGSGGTLAGGLDAGGRGAARWLRHELVLGILFAFGLLRVPVALASAYVSYHGPGGRDWHATPADAPFPFAIECRRNNPVAVEYDKRVAFPAGDGGGLDI